MVLSAEPKEQFARPRPIAGALEQPIGGLHPGAADKPRTIALDARAFSGNVLDFVLSNAGERDGACNIWLRYGYGRGIGGHRSAPHQQARNHNSFEHLIPLALDGSA